MRASLIRTGSVPVQKLTVPHPPKVSLNRQLSTSGDKIAVKSSRRTSMHLNSNDRRDIPARSLNRAFRERDAIRSSSECFDIYMKLNIMASGSSSESTPDKEYLWESELREISEENCIREPKYTGVSAERGYPLEEIGFYGGGAGDNGDHGSTTFTGGNGDDKMKIGAYYEEMLKSMLN